MWCTAEQHSNGALPVLHLLDNLIDGRDVFSINRDGWLCEN
jgi:hypothetical protein